MMNGKTLSGHNSLKRDETGRRGIAGESRKLVILAIITAITLQILLGIYIFTGEKHASRTKPFQEEFVIQRPQNRISFEMKKPKNTLTVPAGEQIRFIRPAIITETEPVLLPVDIDVNELGEIEPEPVIPDIESVAFEPVTYKKEEASAREKGNTVSMRKEFIRPGDLDYGRYKGIIFQKPARKQKIKGFIYIPSIWGSELRLPDSLKRSVINLAEAVNRYTGIRAEIDRHLTLESLRLHDMPFVYITTDRAFELSPAERKNFGDYLRHGGFAVLDNGSPEYPFSQAEASLRQMLRDSLGAHARFLPIPVSHPLYHCFFDFDDGPPQGAEVKIYFTREFYTAGIPPDVVKMSERYIYFLEGIWLGDRLVAVYSDKGYAQKWKELVKIPSKYHVSNNLPQLKMGVNMVVFALTQQGGVAEKNREYFVDF